MLDQMKHFLYEGLIDNISLNHYELKHKSS